MHGHVQITRRSAAQAGLALPGQPDPLSVFDAGRDPHVDGAGAGGDTGALALVAGVLNDRAAPPAVGARFGETERTLVAVDHTRAVARRTHLRAGARPRATAMAVGARRRAGQPQRHCHALGGLDEIQLRLGLQVVASSGPAGTGTGASSEQAAEQVADVRAAGLARGVEQIVEVELGAVGATSTEAAAVETAPAETATGEQPSGLVVLLALGFVRQHAVRLGDGLEPFSSGGVLVRMQIGSQLAVGRFDVFGAGVRGDAQLLVEVFFDPFTLGHVASPPFTFSAVVNRLMILILGFVRPNRRRYRPCRPTRPR